MNRISRIFTRSRIARIFAGFACAIAISEGVLAQTDPLIGTWTFNPARSTVSQGQIPRGGTITYQGAESEHSATAEMIDAQGRPSRVVFTHVYDGQPHPTAGAAYFDASAYTRLNPSTIIFTRMKDGKLAGVGSGVVSQDGKTLTFTGTGASAYGERGNYTLVFEKR